jgi:hypothetical protein
MDTNKVRDLIIRLANWTDTKYGRMLTATLIGIFVGSVLGLILYHLGVRL